jgi:prevent-host-death family protein
VPYPGVMTEFGMHEAKTHLSRLVERALAGEEIVITRRGKPAVRLAPIERKLTMRELRGIWKGVEVPDDAFGELDLEIQKLFEESRIFPEGAV